MKNDHKDVMICIGLAAFAGMIGYMESGLGVEILWYPLLTFTIAGIAINLSKSS